jgi:glycine cleavage system H protein
MEQEFYEYKADKFVFKVKKGFYYSRDETWAKVERDHILVGITDFAQRRGGDIVFAEAMKIGDSVKRGELIGSYETVKIVQDILSPVDGVVAEINPLIDSKPEVINKDPYGEGWLAMIKPLSSVEGLLSDLKYFEIMKAKVSDELKKIKGL